MGGRVGGLGVGLFEGGLDGLGVGEAVTGAGDGAGVGELLIPKTEAPSGATAALRPF